MEEIKAGLEIHQQLDTGKLFCECPSVLRNDTPLFRIERKLNPVAGETGEIDVAAAYEKSKNKTFIYEVYDTNCLVELDEEPPHSINHEALKISLQIAELLNCKIFPVSQVMRKTVIDGSNTSGFQRTILIAHDGWIETSKGRVGIETIALEEDAARPSGKIEVDENTPASLASLDNIAENSKVYKLDRLGIPLVEITTKPEIYSANQVKEAALKIGEILRACKVRRGIGTIRQDLNISIPKGNRIEIKGFQNPAIMIKTVEKEVERQKNLILIHDALKKIAFEFEEIADVSEIFSKTACRLVKRALENKGKVFACKFPGFKGLLGRELYEGKRLGSEVSDYAKVFGVGGIIHSDEDLEKYNFSELELVNLGKRLGIKKGDAFVLVADEEKKAGKAIEAALQRVRMEIDVAVPKEVRKSNEDGSTSFLRPMPGSARMYPETDIELVKISRDLINETKKNLPKLKTELAGYLKEQGLNDELIKLILEEGKVEEFKELLEVIDNPALVAKSLVVFPREIAVKEKKSREEIEDKLNQEVIASILAEVDKKISENEVRIVMQKIISGSSLEDAIKKEKINLKEEIKKLVKEKPALSVNAYMGLIMTKFRGKVNGKEVMDELSHLGIK
jgi:glutamyl-tRNA(Gln) amidotransferase subunit E